MVATYRNAHILLSSIFILISVYTLPSAPSLFHYKQQNNSSVADGPGNAQFMSIRQESLRRGTYDMSYFARRNSTAAAPAAAAAMGLNHKSASVA